MQRKSAVLLAIVTVVTALAASGVAWAVTRDCDDDPDVKCKGTSQADVLNGGEGRDLIKASSGADRLYGNGGDDALIGGTGADLMVGGDGDDRGTTVAYYNSGSDRFYGGDGSDLIDDGIGRNRLYGQADDDELYGSGLIDGGPGDDTIEIAFEFSSPGEPDQGTAIGGPGRDTLRSSERSDDTFRARDGEADDVTCGDGRDTVYFDEGLDTVDPVTCEVRVGG